MEEEIAEMVRSPATRRRSLREKAVDALWICGTALGLMGVFIGMPLWLFLESVRESGLEETLLSGFQAFSPLITVFVGAFVWGWLRNLSENAAKSERGSYAARALGTLSVVIAVAAVILTFALMFTFWDGEPTFLDENCPWRGC